MNHYIHQSTDGRIREMSLVHITTSFNNNNNNYKMVIPGHADNRLIEIDFNDVLGRGNYGYVFRGTLNGSSGAKKVAVKRIQLTDLRDLKNNNRLDKLFHLNVIQLYHIEDDEFFRYFAVDLCAGSLDQYFSTETINKRYKGPQLPPDCDALLHLAHGLEYIHSMRLVHRDIRPENVLIALRPVRLIWSDFGGSLPRFHTPSRRDVCWMAPELLIYEQDFSSASIVNDQVGEGGSVESDTFSLGCVFFYLVTRGLHPFGIKNVIGNILSGDSIYLKSSNIYNRLYKLLKDLKLFE